MVLETYMLGGCDVWSLSYGEACYCLSIAYGVYCAAESGATAIGVNLYRPAAEVSAVYAIVIRDAHGNSWDWYA